MRRTIRLAFLAVAACALSGCVSSTIASSQRSSNQTRNGDSLGHALFAKQNDQSRLARAEAP